MTTTTTKRRHSAAVYYTRKGEFLVLRRELGGKEDSHKYETAGECKAAVAGLLAQGHRVYWAPRATQKAYHEDPVTPIKYQEWAEDQ